MKIITILNMMFSLIVVLSALGYIMVKFIKKKMESKMDAASLEKIEKEKISSHFNIGSVRDIIGRIKHSRTIKFKIERDRGIFTSKPARILAVTGPLYNFALSDKEFESICDGLNEAIGPVLDRYVLLQKKAAKSDLIKLKEFAIEDIDKFLENMENEEKVG